MNDTDMIALKRRNKIIMYNNYCIIEMLSFYDNFFLDNIIRNYLFNDNYNRNNKIREKFAFSIDFMNKYKIVKAIAEEEEISFRFNIDKFGKIRNDIAHNFSGAVGYDNTDKEHIIIFGSKQIKWTEYIKTIEDWAGRSYELAKFVRNLYSKISEDKGVTCFPYYTIENKCVLRQNNLPFINNNFAGEKEFPSSYSCPLDVDIRKWLKEESEYVKGVDPNE